MGIIENGYVLMRNLFPQIIDVKNEIDHIFRTYTRNYDAPLDNLIYQLFANDIDGFIGCANQCQNSLLLLQLASSPQMISALKELQLGTPTLNTRPLLSFSSKKTAKNDNYWKVPPHQDWPSMQGSLNSVTCWVPLVDVDAELGPLEIIPKSHLEGYLPHNDDGVPLLQDYSGNFESFPMKSGDALFFNVFTIHRSGINISEKIRLSAHFRYDDASEPSFIARKYPRHRIDERKKGILHPGFPSQKEIQTYFGRSI